MDHKKMEETSVDVLESGVHISGIDSALKKLGSIWRSKTGCCYCKSCVF